MAPLWSLAGLLHVPWQESSYSLPLLRWQDQWLGGVVITRLSATSGVGLTFAVKYLSWPQLHNKTKQNWISLIALPGLHGDPCRLPPLLLKLCLDLGGPQVLVYSYVPMVTIQVERDLAQCWLRRGELMQFLKTKVVPTTSFVICCVKLRDSSRRVFFRRQQRQQQTDVTSDTHTALTKDFVKLILTSLAQSFLNIMSYKPTNQTIASFLAWGLVVVLLGTGMGDSRIRISLSNHAGQRKVSKVK
jgi:hypothetical protein